MADPFATSDDVADLWRPLTDTESNQVDSLLLVASAQLRQRLRNIDDRIALFASTPTADLALDPILAVNAVVNAVRRYLNNPTGALNQTVTTGPYSKTIGYGERTGSQFLPRGVVLITDDDVAPLLPPDAEFVPGAIRQQPWWARC
jgi:hypothetical protein